MLARSTSQAATGNALQSSAILLEVWVLCPPYQQLGRFAVAGLYIRTRVGVEANDQPFVFLRGSFVGNVFCCDFLDAIP